MLQRKLVVIGFLTIVIALLAGCGAFSPPEDCGVGGTADEAAFARHFTAMTLVSAQTGEPGETGGEGGVEYDPGVPLAIQYESLETVALRVCVMERKGSGNIVFDQTRAVEPGPGNFTLDQFEGGPYVARVSVDGVLILNLTFTIR